MLPFTAQTNDLNFISFSDRMGSVLCCECEANATDFALLELRRRCLGMESDRYETCIKHMYIICIYIYCRASHTGDAGRGRGRERERGMSSELANMTC